ncbi:hypothetical protein AB0H36_08550 [Kribbella sp. NPDC050820]|uniref:hypothetical protein n=1 Tax=Kribbella sp. NPDC050820 TaxID=3155408 RepID=UPI0033C4FB54
MTDGIWLRFLSGPDIDGLGLIRLAIVDAVEAALREHGKGRTSFEPWWNVTMLDDLFDLDEIRVTSRRPKSREKLAADLSAEAQSGRKPGRENDAERTLFWHRGLSLLDVAIAHLILRKAEAADAGTMLRFH